MNKGVGMRSSVVVMVALVGLVFSPPARAAEDAERNAALDYLRVILMSQDKDALFDDAEAALEQMHPKPGSEQEPMDAPEGLVPGGPLAEGLEAEAWLLRKVERASLEERCDFQVRYEDGHAMMMPHVGSMRTLGLVMVADARRLALAGDPQGAADRLAAALRLARHLSNDRILIVSLLANQIGEMAIKESFWLLGRTGDADGVKASIHAALERFSEDDPFFFEAALRTERDIVAHIGVEFQGPTAVMDYMRAFASRAEFESADEADLVWKAMGGGEFGTEVDKAVRAFEIVFEAWDASDPQAELAEFETKVAEGDHGIVAMLVLPSFSRYQGTHTRAQERIEALRARVKGDR